MKIKSYLTSVALMLTSQVSTANQEPIILDKYLSPYSGSSLIQNFNEIYKSLDDRYLLSSAGKTNFIWVTARFSKLLIETIFAEFLTTAQHEIFGHGYRGREFRFSKIMYRVGIGSGYTAFYMKDYNRLTLNQKAAFSAAGNEANTILAQQLRATWLKNNLIDNRDATLYYANQFEQIKYVYITKEYSSNSNDIIGYMKNINAWHGNNTTLTLNKLRLSVLWDLLDPALYNSLSSIGSYLVTGKQQEQLFMFTVGRYKYLPSARTLFTPWGLEYQLQNYIKTPTQELIQVNLRYGKTSSVSSYGLDLHIKPIWSYKHFTFGNKLSLWKQPKLGLALASLAPTSYGIAEYINIEYAYNKIFSLYGEIGYKTAGYIPGNPLENGVVYGAGFTINL